MATNPYVEKDYYAEAVSRYPNVHVDKPIFDKYVQLLLSGLTPIQGVTTGDTINDVMASLMAVRSIDTASGDMLDNIGAILGEPRGTLPTSIVASTYFVFQGSLPGGGFSDLVGGIAITTGSPAGGIFADSTSVGALYQTWNDATYRLFLKTRILRNSSKGTPQDIINALTFILGGDYVLLTEGPDPASITVTLGNPDSAIERYLITGMDANNSVLPVPLGVGIKYIGFITPFFAFYGVSGAHGFGEFLAAPAGYGLSYGEAYGTGASAGLTPGVGGYFSAFIV